MGRNTERVDIVKHVVDKHFGEYKREDAVVDNDFLELTLNAVFSCYTLLKVKKVHILYGLPVILTDNSIILITPYVDNVLFSTLTPDGRYRKYSEEEVLNRFIFTAENEGLKPERITFKVFSSFGFIKKEVDADFDRHALIHYKNRLFNIKIKREELLWNPQV